MTSRPRPSCYAALALETPPLDFGKVLEIVAAFFERESLSYAVVGAFGLHAYGLTRATLDLDFVAQAEAQPRLVPFLESMGYETLHVSPGYSNHLHGDGAMGRVDFVYVRGDTNRLLFAGCKPLLSLGGRAVPVPRAEHLAAMKVQAIKNDPERTFQEMADLQFLLRLPGIEQDEVKSYFEGSGLLEKYHEIQRLL